MYYAWLRQTRGIVAGHGVGYSSPEEPTSVVTVTSGTPRKAPFGLVRERLDGVLIAGASRTFICTGVTPNEGAVAWNERLKLSVQGAVLLLYSRATHAIPGANCLSRDSHFPPMSYSKALNPVTLPQSIIVTLRPPIFDQYVLPLDIARFIQALT